MTRHRERVEHVDLLLDDAALGVVEAADRVGVEPAALAELAEGGKLPPWLADLCGVRGWLFHPGLSAKIVESQTSTGLVWVPVLAEAEAVLTAEWVSERPAEDRAALMSWLRAATPDPLEAGHQQWMWWCSHHPDAMGCPPTAALVAVRWRVTCDWYDLLTDTGIGHSAPHLHTTVTVARVTETPDTAPASDPADEGEAE